MTNENHKHCVFQFIELIYTNIPDSHRLQLNSKYTHIILLLHHQRNTSNNWHRMKILRNTPNNTL